METDDRKWYFTKQQLLNTPSRKQGLDFIKELNCRHAAANFIHDCGTKLQVSRLCINTAIMYMHRFYMFHSFTLFPKTSIGASALFLAAKVEEQPRKVEHIIKVSHIMTNKENPTWDTKSETYLKLVDDMLFCENLLLQTLGFELRIQHAHKFIIDKDFIQKDVLKGAYYLATVCIRFTLFCLQYRPKRIACMCLHLAAKLLKCEIPKYENKDWFLQLEANICVKVLKELTEEFMNFINEYVSNLKYKVLSLNRAIVPSTYHHLKGSEYCEVNKQTLQERKFEEERKMSIIHQETEKVVQSEKRRNLLRVFDSNNEGGDKNIFAPRSGNLQLVKDELSVPNYTFPQYVAIIPNQDFSKHSLSNKVETEVPSGESCCAKGLYNESFVQSWKEPFRNSKSNIDCRPSLEVHCNSGEVNVKNSPEIHGYTTKNSKIGMNRTSDTVESCNSYQERRLFNEGRMKNEAQESLNFGTYLQFSPGNKCSSYDQQITLISSVPGKGYQVTDQKIIDKKNYPIVPKTCNQNSRMVDRVQLKLTNKDNHEIYDSINRKPLSSALKNSSHKTETCEKIDQKYIENNERNNNNKHVKNTEPLHHGTNANVDVINKCSSQLAVLQSNELVKKPLKTSTQTLSDLSATHMNVQLNLNQPNFHSELLWTSSNQSSSNTTTNTKNVSELELGSQLTANTDNNVSTIETVKCAFKAGGDSEQEFHFMQNATKQILSNNAKKLNEPKMDLSILKTKTELRQINHHIRKHKGHHKKKKDKKKSKSRNRDSIKIAISKDRITLPNFIVNKPFGDSDSKKHKKPVILTKDGSLKLRINKTVLSDLIGDRCKSDVKKVKFS